jgi:hypothetical protein
MDEDYDGRTAPRRWLINIQNLVRVVAIGLVARDDDAILWRRLQK